MKQYYLHLLTILCLLILFNQCSEKSTAPEDQKRTKDVLVLGDDGTEDSLMAILQAGGMQIDFGGPYYLYNGENIENYKTVVFLNGVEWTEVMPGNVQEIIKNYVSGGGILFSIEWISWSGALNQIINDILPVMYGGWWDSGSEYYYKMMDHAISQALPDTFLLPNGWSYSNTILDATPSKNAQLIFQGSQSSAAVVVGDFNNGKVIHWNMGGQWAGINIWSPEVKQLLLNIVNYALSVSG